jgi:hypothetical protein
MHYLHLFPYRRQALIEAIDTLYVKKRCASRIYVEPPVNANNPADTDQDSGDDEGGGVDNLTGTFLTLDYIIL